MNNKNITKGLIACVAISGAVINSFANNKENVKEVQYTTIDENQIVNIPDSNLKKGINVALGKGEVLEDISIGEMRSLTSLDVSNRNISRINGLEYAVNLKSLNLNSNKISDIYPLQNLTNLTNFYAHNNQISDITVLRNLDRLSDLRMGENKITDISILNNLINLKYIDLSNNNISNINSLKNLTKLNLIQLEKNQITDISALSNLTNLTNLNLGHNKIVDISILNSLINLKYLYLTNNQISDISVLSNLTSLVHLYISKNQISDISVLSSLISLEHLSIYTNNICDITPLSNLTNLIQLDIGDNSRNIDNINALANLDKLELLSFNKTNIEDISILSNFPRLRTLNISNNKITDISVLSNLVNLTQLSMNNNQISDITSIENLTNLAKLRIHSNQISDISVLSNLTNLVELYMCNNQISDISALSNLTSLKYLVMYTNNVYDITPLSNLTNLIQLDIGDNSRNIDNINALANLDKLEILSFNSTNIEDISILSNFSKLQTLNISNNKIADISALNNLINLKDLRINNNKISDISVLSNLTKLNVLHMNDNFIFDISSLNKLNSITTISIYNQKPTISRTVKLDSNIFNVKIDNPIKGINGEKIEITSISNNGYYENGKICWDNLDIGDYTFKINFNKVYNIDGNNTTYNGTATINLSIVDGVAPEVSNNDFINEDELAIYTTITAEDLFSEVDYLIHNKERHSLPYTFKYDVFNMDNNAVEVFDTAGNSITYNITPNNLSTEVLNQYIDIVSLNATNEDISYIRTIVNNMSESSNKDILSERINDISLNIELEKKISSVSLDLYIKSENILQMSLDTNQISFDDFSGVEDVAKENAVNVTINSSLPYQLNAYLPSEIQNSDKTKTLDKSILNIKESSESVYQTFSNTTDKIVLKDNCSSGNQLTHGVDLKLAGGIAHEKDVYKAIIKLEAEQK